MTEKDPVEICDVAPRDGFQAVKTWIPTDTKVAVVNALAAAGLPRIEVGSFVNPKAVPQMADSGDVHAAIALPDTRLTALIANLRGAENAFAAGVTDLGYVFSVTESHNQNNVRRTVDESIAEFARVLDAGKEVDGFKIRANLATAFDCPFDGTVSADDVYACLDKISKFDVPMEVALCDTTGRAIPAQVGALFVGAKTRFAGLTDDWIFHGHDTYGLGVANALFAYDAGVRIFDSACAGLGGCPFAPGATGNTATEDLVFTFENSGIKTGVDLEKLLDAAQMIVPLPDAQTGGHLRLIPRDRAIAA